jgi:hypothetical protein
MPVTPSALAKMTRSCSFGYLGETVNLKYYPAALGGDFAVKAKALYAELNKAEESGDEAQQQEALLHFGQWMCTFLAWWDFLEDDGETMQPITPENLATQIETFSDFILAVIQCIGNSYNQGNANGTPSLKNSKTTSSMTGALDSRAASPIPSESASSPDGSTEPPPSNG